MPSNVASTPSVGFQAPAASARDVEKAVDSATKTASESLDIDIEHVRVDDDPRKWSSMRKTSTLCLICCASTLAGLGANIFNPSIKQVEADLRTTSAKISLSLSIFIVCQGVMPLLWTAISEIKGRKLVYVVTLTISMVGYIVAAEAKSIDLFIAMRAIQGTGSSSVVSIGAATLADIYEPCERGAKLGIFYAGPLLGPSLGPIFGGLLTQAFSWRASFWLMAAALGINLVLFVFLFRDTFRQERSLTYQRVLASRRCAASKRSSVVSDHAHELDTKSKGEETVAVGETSGSSGPGTATAAAAGPQAEAEITPSFKDVNPFAPVALVMRRWNNVAALLSSGLLFAFSFTIAYTCSRTLGDHYNYDAIKIGFVLLSFGAGSILGCVLGGRWSDHVLRRLTSANGGHSFPEMRLESTKLAMVLLPPAVIAYAWLAQERVHVASLCVVLIFIGFFSTWIYSSTLAYIVDANSGRSSVAVATNSCFRGVAAFVFTEAAVPLQNSIGDGWLYTLWAGILVLCGLLLLLVQQRGGAWREAADERERPRS